MNEPNPPYVQVPVPTVLPHTSTLAIVSLIAGIVSWILLPFISAIVAVITGHMAKSEIKKSMGMVTGNGMATAGLVLGYINLALALCALCVAILLLAGLITVPFTIPFITPAPNY